MEQPQTYVNTTTYTSNIAVGGPGGNIFSLFATWPQVVKQVTFHRDEDRMIGLDFQRYDSSGIKLGRFIDPNPVTFYFEESELITRILLYSSHFGNGRFVGLKLCTTRQTMEAFGYGYCPVDSDQVEIPVGNGKWSGVFGRGGADIDCLGLGMCTGEMDSSAKE